MTVIMTMRGAGDGKALEQRAAENPDGMRAIADRAEEHGLIAHRFYGADNGQIMVIDEWPDAESFQRFWESTRSEIEQLMSGIGMTGEPEVTFWRKLESRDEVGWDS